MARTVDDLAVALPIVAGPDWIDSAVHDVPLLSMDEGTVKGLRVAFHTTNAIMPARADVAGAVSRAARALEASGASVEEAVPPGIEQCMDIFMSVATADGGEGLRTLLAMAGTTTPHALMNTMLNMCGERKSAAFLHNGLRAGEHLSQQNAIVPQGLRCDFVAGKCTPCH